MPNIKTDTYNLDGAPFKRIIKVNASGLFTCQLPPGWSTALGYGECRGSTMDEVDKKFRKAMADYKEINTVERKVIIYKVGLNARIKRDGRVFFERSDNYFADGCSISIAAAVFIEKKFSTGNGKEQFDFKEAKSTIPASMQNIRDHFSHQLEALPRMDWTAEREAFFTRLGLAMESITLEVSKLTGDQQKILAVVDSGKLLT